jgi:hypothetical protein
MHNIFSIILSDYNIWICPTSTIHAFNVYPARSVPKVTSIVKWGIRNKRHAMHGCGLLDNEHYTKLIRGHQDATLFHDATERGKSCDTSGRI